MKRNLVNALVCSVGALVAAGNSDVVSQAAAPPRNANSRE